MWFPVSHDCYLSLICTIALFHIKLSCFISKSVNFYCDVRTKRLRNGNTGNSPWPPLTEAPHLCISLQHLRRGWLLNSLNKRDGCFLPPWGFWQCYSFSAWETRSSLQLELRMYLFYFLWVLGKLHVWEILCRLVPECWKTLFLVSFQNQQEKIRIMHNILAILR